MKWIFLLICIAIPFTASADAPSIKIGVVAPLTGTAAASGITIKNSILLADQQFDVANSVEFIFEDDQLSPKNTVSAVNKLIASDRVKGLIIFGSPTSLAVNSIAESHQVPMIALSIVDRVVKNFTYVVKLWVPARTENELLAQEITTRNYKKIAIVATTNDAMLSLKSLLAETLPDRVVAQEEVSREETDFRALVTRVLSKSPDAIYNLLWAPQPGLFARVLRENGFKGEIFGAHNLEDQNQIEASSGALENSWFVTGDDSPASKFLDDYANRFGTTPTAGGPNAYDAAKLFIQGTKTSDINSFLHSVKDFDGAYGRYSASGENDFTIQAKRKFIRQAKVAN